MVQAGRMCQSKISSSNGMLAAVHRMPSRSMLVFRTFSSGVKARADGVDVYAREATAMTIASFGREAVRLQVP